MYLNQETGEIIPVEEVRNNETGLFFIQRDGSEIKGDIPIDHLAF